MQRLDTAGSTLFNLTWKRKVTPLGRRYLERAASGRRIAGSDCTSWPTPNAMEGGQTSRGGKRKGEKLMGGIAQLAAWPTREKAVVGCQLPVARMASWPTPNCPTGGPNSKSTETHTGGRDLDGVATLASWATPCSNDDNKSVEAHLAMKKRMGERDGTGANRTAITSLQVQAKLATRVPNPKSRVPVSPADSGPTPNGSGAVTGSGGQLNPGHSRWLMGCRLAWQECNPKFEDWRKWQGFLTTLSNGQRVFGSAPCAAMVMRSARQSRKGSSKPIWNRRKLNADG